MARRGRLHAPGALYHMMIRGIECRRIFRTGGDRLDCLSGLNGVLPEEGWRGLVRVVIPNHVHLVLQSAQGGFSRLMAWLDTGRARGFNLRHHRSE